MVKDTRGFTLVEFLIAMAITAAVLGGTVALASQIQRSYSTQLDDTTAEEEVRFALDWISQALRNAGTNPYGISVSTCASAAFSAITLDPDGDGDDDDVQIHADINPPDGLLGGQPGACGDPVNGAGEDVTIAYDPDELVITRQDNNADDDPVTMTEPVIGGLTFTYLNSARVATTDPDLVAYVQVAITARSQARTSIQAGEAAAYALTTEVRLRTR
ncbi:MAG: hypothetical protein A3F70_15650 [Acidobacteria bacterium RIFCSPLOWO2_12_FULL_67_14]|nr:MAG: hypothetical protein A3H29_03300 [Acidobacteria bacterium RIFCSPLOWO2_02_FULL_67_21]OFW35320.1 MAG: hypothetical protein A3F70_15650 [Acidobacteria bacterium RIFCSPLOWO2_12_FULL_67_14]